MLPFPEVTRALLGPLRRPSDGDNLGLWMDRLLPLQAPTSGAFVAKNSDPWSIKGEFREFVLDQLCPGRPWRSEACQDAMTRLVGSVGSLPGTTSHSFQARIEGRLLVDFGRFSPIENGLGFHPSLGVPRIPGSAIHGLARAWFEDTANSPGELQRLFGTPMKAGAIVTYDALPTDGSFELAIDVLTPHFPDYYAGFRPPSDDQDPNPVAFLSVVNTIFTFVLSAPSACEDELQRVAAGLQDALWAWGLGAKKSAGYGRLVVDALED